MKARLAKLGATVCNCSKEAGLFSFLSSLESVQVSKEQIYLFAFRASLYISLPPSKQYRKEKDSR